MSPKSMEIKYKNTSYFEDRIRGGLFLFVANTANGTLGHKRNDAEQRLPLGGKLSAELTDEGFVNLFKDKYNDASHLPLIRHFPRKMPPSPKGEGVCNTSATLGHKA